MELTLPARLAASSVLALTVVVGGPVVVSTPRADQTQTRGVRHEPERGNLVSLSWLPNVAGTTEDPLGVTTDVQRRKEGVMNRIERLKSLSAGWLGEGSKAPDAHLVAWLEAHSEVLARAPYKIAVSPVADGSVALQWMMGSRELTAELRPDDTIYLFVDYRDTDDFDEGTTQLDPQALETFILAGGLGHAA